MHVAIVPVGEVSADVKREASGALRSVYDCEVTVQETQPIPSGAYNAQRKQHRAEDFIQLARRVGAGAKNLAVTDEDLYYSRRNYVFGLAYLDGEGSVISTYRLADDTDGRQRLEASTDGGFSDAAPGDVFADRVRKEVVHEIGHTLGLEHCSNNRCVMSFSPTVNEVDIKEEDLCGSCRREVL